MQFELWAPQAERVTLQCDDATRALERDPGREGWWRAEAEARDGSRYGYALDEGPVLPDPQHRPLDQPVPGPAGRVPAECASQRSPSRRLTHPSAIWERQELPVHRMRTRLRAAISFPSPCIPNRRRV